MWPEELSEEGGQRGGRVLLDPLGELQVRGGAGGGEESDDARREAAEKGRGVKRKTRGGACSARPTKKGRDNP